MCYLFSQTQISFGREFSEAVEAKQVAQQEAERARYLVEKVKCSPGVDEQFKNFHYLINYY